MLLFPVLGNRILMGLPVKHHLLICRLLTSLLYLLLIHLSLIHLLLIQLLLIHLLLIHLLLLLLLSVPRPMLLLWRLRKIEQFLLHALKKLHLHLHL